MTDKEFLNWIIDRFVHVYNESPNVDFIHRLQNIANKLEFLEKHDWRLSLSKGESE
jgi:hypothetical protein